MIRTALSIVTAVALAGCSASTSFHPQSSSTRADETAQLAAYAATAEYPTRSPAKEDLRAAAVVNRDNGSIRIYNFTDRPLTGANVWINGAYVQRADTIPARGSVALSRNRFFDRSGTNFASGNAPINRVELQFDNDLYMLMGPVYQ